MTGCNKHVIHALLRPEVLSVSVHNPAGKQPRRYCTYRPATLYMIAIHTSRTHLKRDPRRRNPLLSTGGGPPSRATGCGGPTCQGRWMAELQCSVLHQYHHHRHHHHRHAHAKSGMLQYGLPKEAKQSRLAGWSSLATNGVSQFAGSSSEVTLRTAYVAYGSLDAKDLVPC